jgi:hypothetical protein
MGRTEEAIAGYGRHWALGRLVFGRFLCDADGFLDPGGSNTHSSQVASDRPREGSREVEAVLPPLPPMPGTVDDTWRNNVTSPWTWRSCANQIGAYGEPVAGEGGGFFVTCAELGDRRGYMKPRRKAVGPFSNRAAREKIVSDLAHDLGTSVPPVMLATRENAPSSEEALVCVSLVMYPLQWPWKVMKELVVDPSRNERASNIVMNDLPIAAAQGWALDTWVSQPDHNDHPQNIFYGYERGDTPAGRFCFLDYAWALGHQMVESAFKWRGGGWRNVGAAPFPPHMLRFMSTDALLSVVERIEQFPEDTIRNVVERIPRVYMDDDEKDVVIEGLLGRRQMVRELTTRGA